METRRHWHIVPAGNPPDAQGWEFPETARQYGRKLYGPRRYRLLECHASGCAVYPPVASPTPHAPPVAAP